LGKGAFGQVFAAHNRIDKSFLVAIKVINKAHLSEHQLKEINREVAILAKVDHPNITNYFETHEDARNINLVMELCEGGDLSEKVNEEIDDGNFPEE